MKPSSAETSTSAPGLPARLRKVLARPEWTGLCTLWGILVAWSLARAFIPGVNEPHYFCKAKYWWNPEWCAGDFFLASSNPHLVFYLTFGWLTRFFSLEITAFIARLLSLLVVARGWQVMSRLLLPRLDLQALALVLLLLCQSLVNFSGEWLVGGVESKVLAYGLGFWAIGTAATGKGIQAACLLGGATSFHPLVGIWLTLCVLGGVAWSWRDWSSLPSRGSGQGSSPRYLRQYGGIVTCWLLWSLPGLIPALWMLLEPVSPRTRFAGDYLQVYYRLKHHLDPMEFPWWRYAAYAGMGLLVWVCHIRMKQTVQRQSRELPFAWKFMIGVLLMSVLIAVTGVLLGLRFGLPEQMPAFTLRLKLLKFYPFRIFDLLLPVLLSILACAYGLASSPSSETRANKLWVLLASLLLAGLLSPFPARNSSRLSDSKRQAWLETCDWIRTHTPPDALIQTPRLAWGFKWFAERAEYVNYKDCPQESSGIVEWNRRLLLLREWGQSSHANDQVYSREETADLASRTGIAYLVADRLGPFAQPPVFRNHYYRVYALGEE